MSVQLCAFFHIFGATFGTDVIDPLNCFHYPVFSSTIAAAYDWLLQLPPVVTYLSNFPFLYLCSQGIIQEGYPGKMIVHFH